MKEYVLNATTPVWPKYQHDISQHNNARAHKWKASQCRQHSLTQGASCKELQVEHSESLGTWRKYHNALSSNKVE